MRYTQVAVLAMAMPLAMFAQEFRGTLSGSVTDPTGAAVAGAKIATTETHTQAKGEAVSDASGNFTVAFLLAGDYDIAVRAPGFKEAVKKAVHLGAGEHPSIDFRMEVGDAKQTVEVTADVPLINSENASVGEAISTKDVEDMPSNGGTPTTMAFLAPGVIMTSQPSQILPFASGGAASFSMGGMPQQQNELLVDGVPNTTWDGRLAYSPPREAVQEVRTKVFDTDAAYGRTAGGTANIILRSGTNQLHGSVSYYNQPNNMVANDLFRNKAGQPATVTHFNQGGLSVSGPMLLPRLFDGRNRLFWMFGYEKINASSPNTTFVTVPTTALRNGDFTKLLTVNGTAIYDPATTVQNGTAWTRSAFPGNVIPSTRLNPIAQKYLQYVPAANLTSSAIVRADDYQNYSNNSPTRDGFTNELGRLDFNLGTRSRTYFNVRHTDYYQTKNDYFKNISTGSNLSRSNWGGSLDEVYMLSPSTIVNARVNYTRMYEDHSAPSYGFDPTTLGFPSYMATNSVYPQLPMMSFSSNSGFTSLGMNGANTLPSQSLQFFGSLVAIRGNHTLKAGADFRQYRLNYFTAGNSTGQFSFSGNSWVRASSSASSTVAMGQDWASFMLGLPYTSSGSVYDINSAASLYQYYGGFFIQDDWRVSKTLSVNLGLRYDRDFPWNEKWSRVVNGYAFNSDSPLAPAAIAKYAASPSPLLAAGDFRVKGGLTFADSQSRAMFKHGSSMFSPRIGVAWTPDFLHGKTVFRAGAGLFVAPMVISQLGASGTYSTNPLLTTQGYNQSTAMAPTNDSYVTVAATISNPFPSGISKPAGSSGGLLTYAGQNVASFNEDFKSPYSTRWNFSAQHALTPTVMVEVLYLGSHSVHLPITYTQLNSIPSKFLSTMGTRDATVNTALSATVANPFQGLNTSIAASKTITTAQVLARYPQFSVGSAGFVSSAGAGVVRYNVSDGASFYNAVNFRVSKRFSSGLSVTASYMRSHGIDQNTWLNSTDGVPERRVSPIDRPNVVKMMMSYQLPVGRGRWLNINNRWLDTAIGGWKTSSTYTFQTGQPIVWSNGDYVYYGGKLNMNPRGVNGNAFDTTRFDVTSGGQFAYHIRTFSTIFPDVRQDGVNQFDVSLLKEFSLGERRSLTVKCDSFNAANHPTFAAPNVTPTNSAFGTITAMANKARTLQLGARIVF
jgi:hypothetical protein